jgi:tetratricopeptide (TPR) repeat protein
MNDPYIDENYQKIIGLINQKRLKEAFVLLERFLSESALWDLSNQLQQIQTSYNYMLQYMRLGVPDPDRKKVYQKLRTDTIEITDWARIERLAFSPTYFLYHRVRTTLSAPFTIKTALKELENYADDMAVASLYDHNNADNDPFYGTRKRHEEVYHVLFLAVWTNCAWSSLEASEANELLQSVVVPVNDVCLFVSAVTLSLMECFDLRKFLYLFDAYNHNATEINQRALIGIALIIHLYIERLSLYPEVAMRLAFLNEKETFGKELNRIYIQLLLCRETEKIDKKMREEIIPEMLKSVKNFRHTRLNLEETDEEKDDYNPDWQDAIEQSGLGDKIREITDLQVEGADIYMSTFSALKTYPFFRSISNWFYPFDKQHSEVVKEMEMQKNNAIMDVIFQAPFFCDSDKYSLCFTMATISPSQRDAMISQMTAGQDWDEFSKKQDALMMEERAKQPETLSSQYLRNLYRFFKLHPRRHEFRDVFDERIELHKYPVLADVLDIPEHLLKIADYYFRKNYPAEAAEIYANIVVQTDGNAELFQKIGYCKQKEKKYAEAIDAYLKADMLQPDNLWTNRHLAACYRIIRSFEKALKYYREIETIQPDDSNVLFYIGSCFAGLERYDEALNYFYKLDLLESDSLKAWRAIGWCSFVIGKYEQAEKYYNKILEKKPLASDYLNVGHVVWSMKRTEKAIELYSKAIEQCGNKNDFLEWFYKDCIVLMKQGIDEEDIWLMLDLL